MSYRNYLFVVNRRKLAKIKKSTSKELWDMVKENPEEWDYTKDGVLCPPYYRHVLEAISGEEVIQVAESIYYKDSDFEVKKYLKKLFKDKFIQKYYNEDTEFMVAKPEILDGLIGFYIQRVKKFYTQLLQKDSDNPKDELGYPLKPQLERLEQAARFQLSSLNFVNDSESKWQLSTAWLYEYDIFNLIHIKKMFDPKKHVLIWTGS